MNEPSISVVICAYTEDRWDDLMGAVESVQAQSRQPDEIIVVIDHNEDLWERARDAMPDIVVTQNVRPRGLSGARNSGVAVARGEVIAFLDDDAKAEPQWLATLLSGYADERVLGVGGYIQPVWVDGRPRWFPEEFAWVVGCSYRGLPRQTAPVRNLIGANMSARREVFAAIGGFRDELGRVGARPSGIEETEWCIRAGQHWPGHRFIYEPRARVRHRVPAARARFFYLAQLCHNEGLAKAQMARLVGSGDGLAAERSYATRTLPMGIMRGLAEVVLRGDPAGVARAGAIIVGVTITTVGYARGRLRGSSQR